MPHRCLLTHADLADRERYLNARTTLTTLLNLRVIPIINENDTVVTDEIKFGDNDTLGALVANLIEADVLIILTDQSGLYTADPRKDASATLVHSKRGRRCEAGKHGGRRGQPHRARRHDHQDSRGKTRGAQRRAHRHRLGPRTRCAVAPVAGRESIGTLLIAPTLTLAARKQWLADHLQVAGKLVLDAGAIKALRSEGKSLLPIGVKSVSGEFERGAVVACVERRWQRHRARPVQLQRRRSAPDRAASQQGDRNPAGLWRRYGDHPQGQSGICCKIQQNQIAAQTNISEANVKLRSSGRSHNLVLL